jgi:UDP-glucose 4-epimerase
MRLLVTGVSGFAGTHIARALAGARFEVVGCFRRANRAVQELEACKGIELICADLAQGPRLPGPFDAVIHIAATSPAPGVTPEQIVRDNVASMLSLLESARGWNASGFVLFSSLSLYGEIASDTVDESCPVINPDVYGTTKHLCEALLQHEADRLPGLALRLPGVLGPGAHRNWLSSVADKLLRGEAIRAYQVDAPFNNAAHVADISRLLIGTLHRGWQGFDAVVLGARETLRLREVIARLAAGLHVEATIEPVLENKPAFVLSSRRAIERWGYDPMTIGAMIDRYAAEVLAERVKEHA